MSLQDYNDLVIHFGHTLSIAIYGDKNNARLQCENCNEDLLDFYNEG